VCVFHRHDVGHLRDAEQRGDARHQVLAEGGAGAEDMRVTGSELRHLRREHLRDGMRVGGVGHREHARDAGDLRGIRGDGRRIGREHDDIDGVGLQRLRGGDALRRRCIELAVEVFGNDEDLVRHQSNPFAFSAATSSAASFTITPLLRLAGGA
jgi:hypothetical protein